LSLLRLATSITLTVPSLRLLTKAYLLSVVKAISWCPAPVAMKPTGLRLAVSITVTPLSLASAALLPTHR
jgi:hypothetical protein